MKGSPSLHFKGSLPGWVVEKLFLECRMHSRMT